MTADEGKTAAAEAIAPPAGIRQFFNKDTMAIALLIYIIALAVREIGLLSAGVTWDETAYVRAAISYLDLIPKDTIFNAIVWQSNYETPPVGKLIYAAGIGAFNGTDYNLNAIIVAKSMSAMISAFACTFTFIIGRIVFDRRTGILAGIIIALLPLMVGFGQIASLESPLTFFFTLTMLLFILAMKSGDRRLYGAAAMVAGLTIDTKLNGLLVIPLMALMYASRAHFEKKWPAPAALARSAVGFGLIVLGVVIVFWPWLWADYTTLTHDPLAPLSMTLDHWSYVPAEYLLGTIQAAPLYYLPLYFLVTTPLLVLVLDLAGCLSAVKARDPYKIGVIFWLIIPFAYGLFHFVQGGIRYVIMIYPAVALLAAFGLASLAGRAAGKWPRIGDGKRAFVAGGVLLSAYLVVSLALVSPYYIDYYNSLSGGPQNVENGRLFNVGWWGEGTSACVQYVETHGDPGSTVLMATMPSDFDHFGFFASRMTYYTISPSDIYVYDFGGEQLSVMNTTNDSLDQAWSTDYIIMNEEFVEYGASRIDMRNYTAVYVTSVEGAPLCTVYKRNGHV